MLTVVVEQYLHMNGTDLNGYISSTNSNYIDNLNTSGTYTAIVTDNLGCTDTAYTNLNEPSSININSISVTPHLAMAITMAKSIL